MPSQTPGKESSGCDAESVMPDSASLGDDLHIGNSAWQTQLSQLTNPYGSIETPSPITNDLPSLDVAAGLISPQHHTPVPNTHGHNVQIASSPVHQYAPPPSASSSSTTTTSASITANRRNRNSVTETGFKELGSSMTCNMRREISDINESSFRFDINEERFLQLYDFH